MAEPFSRLARRLSLSDAIFLGMGSMIGAGIFAAAGPAAAAAGNGFLLAVLLAAMISFVNALTMAQLAANFPESGGAYAYGRRLLGPYWGFLAGWGFVVGKTASCTAMALTFAHYLLPSHPRLGAAGAVITLTAINLLGVRKTATATKAILTLVLLSLAVTVLAAWMGGAPAHGGFGDWGERGLSGVLEATGMMFFAFAGYARIATLGEEVAAPERTIPRAILISLTFTLIIYAVVLATTAFFLEPKQIAAAKAPLALLVESGRYAYLSPAVRGGAAIASLGVLLSLMAGVSRTIFAMAANRELPVLLASVHPVHRNPWKAELAVGGIVAMVVLLADTRLAIGFSSFAVLTYYALANLCAWRLTGAARRWPKWMAGLGFVSCVAVALSVPKASVAGGLALFLAGSAAYWIRSRAHRF